MPHAHRHLGAEKVVRGEAPRARADTNLTPLIDILFVLSYLTQALLQIAPFEIKPRQVLPQSIRVIGDLLPFA